MTDKKKILILLPTGMTIRNILCTDILNNILENSEHEIVCAVNNPSKYRKYFEHERVSFIEFHEKKLFTFSNLLLMILRRRFYSINENITLNILKKRKGFFAEGLRGRLLPFLNQPFPKSKLIYGFFQKVLDYFYVSLPEIESQFLKYKPDIVFSTHLVARHEFGYLMVAKNNNIPTIGMVKSFDNLTGKGFLPFKTDNAILWNEIMKKEIIDIYQYKERHTFVSGVPQFDIYTKKPEVSKLDFLRKYNLDEDKKIILFATNHQAISPDDQKTINFIAGNLTSLNAQLLVRLHPMDHKNRYQNLECEDVHYQIPGISEGEGSNERVAHQEFLDEIRDTLYFSDLTINTASTMSLDASALDKPIINIAFDWEKKPYYHSVARYYEFLHYKPILDSKGTSLVSSSSELLRTIEDYLNKPEIKRNERKILVDKMLAGNPGDSSKSISSILINLLDNHAR